VIGDRLVMVQARSVLSEKTPIANVGFGLTAAAHGAVMMAASKSRIGR
jgi:hypothetical protein